MSPKCTPPESADAAALSAAEPPRGPADPSRLLQSSVQAPSPMRGYCHAERATRVIISFAAAQRGPADVVADPTWRAFHGCADHGDAGPPPRRLEDGDPALNATFSVHSLVRAGGLQKRPAPDREPVPPIPCVPRRRTRSEDSRVCRSILCRGRTFYPVTAEFNSRPARPAVRPASFPVDAGGGRWQCRQPTPRRYVYEKRPFACALVAAAIALDPSVALAAGRPPLESGLTAVVAAAFARRAR